MAPLAALDSISRSRPHAPSGSPPTIKAPSSRSTCLAVFGEGCPRSRGKPKRELRTRPNSLLSSGIDTRFESETRTLELQDAVYDFKALTVFELFKEGKKKRTAKFPEISLGNIDFQGKVMDVFGVSKSDLHRINAIEPPPTGRFGGRNRNPYLIVHRSSPGGGKGRSKRGRSNKHRERAATVRREGLTPEPEPKTGKRA